MIRLLRLAGALAMAAIAAPLAAQDGAAQDGTAPDGTAPDGPEATPAPLELFQQLETRLFAVGWKLARANAPFCDRTVPAIGMLIHDAASYGQPDAVRATFGLTGDIGVQAVAARSPAAAAGLTANDTVLAIGGQAIATDFPPGDHGWQRADDLRGRIDDVLATGPITLEWQHGGGAPMRADISPVSVCASRFELLDSSNDASADGERVLMGHRFAPFGWPEDEFAAVVAHEMAHNLLGHIATFEKTGRQQGLVRLSERDADRLMPWLLQNAGYDPVAAVRFMRRYGPRYGGGLLRKRTHDGWDERVAYIEGEVATMKSHIAPDGSADWRRYFRQELAARLAN